jgi:DNA polymerase-3 subunit delta'
VRFADILGQEQATLALRRAIASGHVPHAYLFEGPPGVGKRSAALALALALNCARAGDVAVGAAPVAEIDGCGACEPCRRIAAGLHPDVPTFAPDGAQLVMEQIKAVVALGQSRPHEAAARVIIIDDADTMNASAANALLKTLEEPAARNHLILCTAAPDRLLGTIRSRTQRIRFRPLSAELLLRLAADRGIDRARAEVAVALADGSAARLLTEAGGDDGAAWEAVRMLRAAVTTPGISGALDAAAALGGDKEGKQELPRLLGLLARLYRDALVAAAGAPELALFSERARELAHLGLSQLGAALDAIVEAELAVAGNVNPTLVIERLLIRLKRQERQRERPAA